jgi:4'-phosphopantetheinyl transferase
VLDPGDVEVTFARPEVLDDPARYQAALALLTLDERERVGRFHFEHDRRLHLTARALLRRSLSRWADVPPREWRFKANAYGRPEILAPASPLRFNTSHTHGLAMVCVVVSLEVGVDAERVPSAVPFDVVERSFAAVERAAVRAAPLAEQVARFAEIWTLKEAYVKARGLGLSLPLELIGFEVAPPRLVLGDDSSAWSFELMSPTLLHRAAVCVRSIDGYRPRFVAHWDDG